MSYLHLYQGWELIMSRIKITCSEKDKISLLNCIMESTDCPFAENSRECAEFKDCLECVKYNIEFGIKED